jgi:hypothetical protein
MSSGVAREGIGYSNSKNRQAELNSIDICGFVLESQVVHQKIAKDQYHPDGEAGLGVAIVEIAVIANKILFVGDPGKRKTRPQQYPRSRRLRLLSALLDLAVVRAQHFGSAPKRKPMRKMTILPSTA